MSNLLTLSRKRRRVMMIRCGDYPEHTSIDGIAFTVTTADSVNVHGGSM